MRTSGHQGKINCINASKDGNAIITGGADGNVNFWNFEGNALTQVKTISINLK
jgi:WD40 repeat protein